MRLKAILLRLTLLCRVQANPLRDYIGVYVEKYVELYAALLLYCYLYRNYLEKSAMFDAQLRGKEKNGNVP
jgi:hypothetical protein